MDRLETEAMPVRAETPWGSVRLFSQPGLRGRGRESAGDIEIHTGMGLALTSFHLDLEGHVPETLRAVFLGGYSIPGVSLALAKVSGHSDLYVDGATLGWRAQVQLDPSTGAKADGTEARVILIDGEGKLVRGLPEAESRVAGGVFDAIESAREEDPGMVARLYAGLMGRALSGLKAEAEEVVRIADEACRFRDRAEVLLHAAVEASERQAGPVP